MCFSAGEVELEILTRMDRANVSSRKQKEKSAKPEMVKDFGLRVSAGCTWFLSHLPFFYDRRFENEPTLRCSSLGRLRCRGTTA